MTELTPDAAGRGARAAPARARPRRPATPSTTTVAARERGDGASTALGARIVARAWTDPELQGPPAGRRHDRPSPSWRSRPSPSPCSKTPRAVHHVIVCTLCSCYPSGGARCAADLVQVVRVPQPRRSRASGGAGRVRHGGRRPASSCAWSTRPRSSATWSCPCAPTAPRAGRRRSSPRSSPATRWSAPAGRSRRRSHARGATANARPAGSMVERGHSIGRGEASREVGGRTAFEQLAARLDERAVRGPGQRATSGHPPHAASASSRTVRRSRGRASTLTGRPASRTSRSMSARSTRPGA